MGPEVQRFPLSWPASIPRTSRPSRSRFDRRRTMEAVRQELFHQLHLLGASDIVLSTNIELRLDGQPYSNRKQPSDKGAAVYFSLKKKPYCLPCDQWDRIEDNVFAIAKHVEAWRGQRRWGVGSAEQAYHGYLALPQATGWPEVLGIGSNATDDAVRFMYKTMAMKAHPDNGGSHEEMARLNTAFENFKRERGL